MGKVPLYSLIPLLLLVDKVSSQCFKTTNCTGAQVPAVNERDCCVKTNDALSFGDGSTCHVCIVRGFLLAEYHVQENQRLDTIFQLDVKGETQFGDALLVSGTITSAPDGTASFSDFERLPPTPVINSTEIHLFLTDDEITLEYDDRVLLRFIADNPALIPSLENTGEYVRDTATVFIVDDDLLEVHFEESEALYIEGSPCLLINIIFRAHQEPFTFTFSSVTIAVAESYGFTNFFHLPNSTRATEGEDFTSETTTVTASANSIMLHMPLFFKVFDDNIDEDEKSFAVVAEIGEDVPENISCFLAGAGETECFGRRGVTEISIIDNDPTNIGFIQRAQTVRESTAPLGDVFAVLVEVASVRTAEEEHEMQFHIDNAISSALVGSPNGTIPNADAFFGDESNREHRVLAAGMNTINPLTAYVLNDNFAEKDECFTIRISPSDGSGGNFACNEDVLDAETSFCQHTICITDDDEPFAVSFVETVYTVDESVGGVNVCVTLNYPEFEINFATVNVFVIDALNYSQTGTPLATPDPPSLLGQYAMIEGSDYAQQIDVANDIDNILIHDDNRVICYHQDIYDDMQLEMDEYMSLTLGVRDNHFTTYVTLVKSEYDEASILILDNDVAVVGLERTFYNVSEEDKHVELCADVLLPNTECPIEFPFDIYLVLSNESAGSSIDFMETPSCLPFRACQKRQCLNVSIIHDLDGEKIENFTFTLVRNESLHKRINIDPVAGVVVIYYDDIEVDCGDPPQLQNGNILNSTSKTTYNSVVTYTCIDGYQFQDGVGYNASRTCLASGNWSEENIVCKPPKNEDCEGTECWLSTGTIAALLSGAIVLLIVPCLLAIGVVKLRLKKSANSVSLISNPDTIVLVPPDEADNSSLSLVQQLKKELTKKNMLFHKSQLQLSRVIGQGESGIVYCGYIKTCGHDLVAIKTGKALLGMKDKDKLLKEVSLMLSFEHPNVMPLTGLTFDGETPLIIMPFMSKGSVLSYVREHRETLFLTEYKDHDQVQAVKKMSLGMCYQISKGMCYLAKFKFVHRDLAARNCMIDGNNVVKVSDFGLTEDIYSYNYYRQKDEMGTKEKVPIKWMAPESVETHVFNERTDVWSFGVTCWEVFTCGGVPYAGVPVTTLLSELRSGHRLDRPSNISCSDDIWSVVTSCWSANPRERPKFVTLVNTLTDLLDSDPTYIKLLRET